MSWSTIRPRRSPPVQQRFSLAQMNANRVERQSSPVRVASDTVENLLAAAEREEKAKAMAASRRRLEEVEAVARAKRVREEEQRSLVARAAKMPAKERKKYLETEALLAKGREIAAQLRKEQPSQDVDLSLFGIELAE